MDDFWSMPIGSRVDPKVRGELPGPVYRDAAGNLFQVRRNALAEMEAPQPQEGNALARALLPMGSWRNALAAIYEGMTAPKRAMQGEPVTYGETFGTAMDAMGGGAFSTAPRGSLRMGASLNNRTMYHGTPDSRALRQAGGFEPRTSHVTRAKDVDKWEEVQSALNGQSRKVMNTSGY